MEQKSIKKNTVFSTIKILSSILFPLITFPYITRVLSTDNVGKINFGLSIVSYFTLISSLGISTHAIRECSAVRENKKKLEQIASQIFTINVLTTIIAYICLAITLLFYSKLADYRCLIIIQSFSIVASMLGTDWLNSAMEDFKYITIRTVCFQLLSLILLFIFVHKPEDYMKYAVISVLASGGASITNIWHRKKYCTVRITKDICLKKHLKPIMLLFVMILSQTIFNNLDMTMLGIYVGDAEVGIYSAAHKIYNIVNQLVASLLWVIMPRLSYYFSKNDYNKINELLRKVLGFYFFFGLPCAIGTFFISKDIIIVVAGLDFVDAFSVLRIFMIACMISTAVNAITNYIFIPLYGAKAAAATTALSEFIILIILFVKRDKNIYISNVGKIVISPIIGCICITTVCIACSSINMLLIRFIASIIGSCVVYFIVNYVMKNDVLIEIISTIKSRIKLN